MVPKSQFSSSLSSISPFNQNNKQTSTPNLITLQTPFSLSPSLYLNHTHSTYNFKTPLLHPQWPLLSLPISFSFSSSFWVSYKKVFPLNMDSPAKNWPFRMRIGSSGFPDSHPSISSNMLVMLMSMRAMDVLCFIGSLKPLLILMKSLFFFGLMEVSKHIIL